ncbi:MAG: cob(I)yrinic acid a,c-diamide adenosyltransferase [Eubacterium sp.]
MIHIYYGNGKGKTTAAVGLGMRAYGAGMSVAMVQFLKNNKSSELKALPFEVFNAPDSLPFNPDDSYKAWVDSAVSFVKSSPCQLIILDEMLDVIPHFMSLDCALDLLALEKELVITGHNPIDKLIEIADYVSNIEKIKHPYDNGVGARLGIEY